jgi:uncharacterized protein (TIGR03000 family)
MRSAAPVQSGRTATGNPANSVRSTTLGQAVTTPVTNGSRTVQAGQFRNGQPVYASYRWGSAANNAWGWNNNHHHRNSVFFIGAFPWFWYGPGFFWPWYLGPWDAYPSYYYADNWVTPPAYVAPPQQMPPASDTTARLEVLVPDATAQVQLDGNRTRSTGTVRYYESPPLPGGKEYSYRVTASWNKDGKPVNAELNVGVTPGKVTVVDFTQPQGPEAPLPPPRGVPPPRPPQEDK